MKLWEELSTESINTPLLALNTCGLKLSYITCDGLTTVCIIVRAIYRRYKLGVRTRQRISRLNGESTAPHSKRNVDNGFRQNGAACGSTIAGSASPCRSFLEYAYTFINKRL
ncbi:hypothetical protein BgAZ_108390 [Babesia gibsoni]|uniref:Uncharacterized protein n=1 Tax=Babesia gibsoni TaxID=33632 RepID=A0AAD8PGP9_BABGI|nr:hypothetical protein BgAZ_108390 [Babesia gibsoni]